MIYGVLTFTAWKGLVPFSAVNIFLASCTVSTTAIPFKENQLIFCSAMRRMEIRLDGT